MGNKFSRRRAVVDEKYTRTQGLYENRDVDPRKLRRLILKGQLAPCFPGAEDTAVEFDECPICFLFYPSLNRSKCCNKSICTECFLQIKSPLSARPTQCPFCKTASYVVEYRGEKTTEEKGVEQREEQKVIEAKIRIRQKELHEEEERMLKQEEDQGQNNVPERLKRNFSNLHGFTLPTGDVQVHGRASSNELDVQLDTGSDPSFQPTQTCQPETISRQTAAPQTGIDPVSGGVGCQASHGSRSSGSSFHRLNRMDDFDLDLEEIMVMEAIWLSIQEQGQTHLDRIQLHRVLDSSRNVSDETSRIDNMRDSLGTRAVTGRSSVTSGLAGAIAAMVERQVTSSESIATGEQTCVSNLRASENEPGLSHPELLSGSTTNVGGEQGLTKEKCQLQEAISHIENSGGQELNSWMQVSVQSERTISPLIQAESRTSLSDWLQDHSSEAVEVGTSFSSSIPSASDLPWEGSEFLPPPGMENFEEPSSGLPQPVPVLPDGFEEQMMLAMALSLAEAQAQARGRNLDSKEGFEV